MENKTETKKENTIDTLERIETILQVRTRHLTDTTEQIGKTKPELVDVEALHVSIADGAGYHLTDVSNQTKEAVFALLYDEYSSRLYKTTSELDAVQQTLMLLRNGV